MLLAIQNLIEYLNRNYLKDENIEEEVSTMTKTLYDPAVEQKGIEKGIERGKVDILLKQLLKKFKDVPGYYREKLLSLDGDIIDNIALEIFDMKSIDDLNKYIAN